MAHRASRSMRVLLLITVLLATSCGGSGAESHGEASSNIIDLGSLHGSAGQTRATELNRNGVVVGAAGPALAGTYPAFWRWTAESGIKPLLNDPNISAAFDIRVNNSGDIVYLAQTPHSSGANAPGPSVPIFVHNGERTQLSTTDTFSVIDLNNRGVMVGCDQASFENGPPCWKWTPARDIAHGTKMFFENDLIPAAINDLDDVVATKNTIHNGAFVFETFLLTHDGNRLTIPSLGGAATYPTALENNGIVIGASDTPATFTAGAHAANIPLQHAVAFNSTTGLLTDLDGRPDGGSVAYGINGSGVIVGSLFTLETHNGISLPSASHAFLYHPSFGMKLLESFVSNLDGWELREALSVNDQLQIVGNGIHHGINRAFLIDLRSLRL